MRGSREVGTWGVLTTPSRMEKQKSCNVPQDYWFGTFGKAQSYRCQVIIGPLAMRLLNGSPFWLLGIGFIGTLVLIPFPF